MPTVNYFTVGPVDEAKGRYVSRHNKQSNIDTGNFLLTDDITEAFIWNASRFANLFCATGNFKIKPVEDLNEEDDSGYVITSLVPNGRMPPVQRDISTLPILRGHRLAESHYESKAQALYVRNIIEREHPEVGEMHVVDYANYQAAVILESNRTQRRKA